MSNKNISYEVDIIIPVHEQFPFLIKTLMALPAAFKGINYKVICVDDASPTPLSTIWDSMKSDNYRLIVNRERLGFPKSCNLGLQAGVADYVLFLNSDCTLFESCGKMMVEALKADKDAGIVSPLLLFPPDSTHEHRPPNKVQHAGIIFDVFGNPVHVFVGWDPNHPKVAIQREMQAVSGACLMIKRDVARKVGELIHKHDKSHKANSIFQEDYGLGCLTADTFIFTANGIQTLGALMPSKEFDVAIDTTVASRNDSRKATLAHVNGVQKTLKVTTEKSFEITGTPNHKIIVMGGDGEPIWKEIQDVTTDDFVAIRKGINLWGKKHLEADEAYFMGLYTAEGSTESVNGEARRIAITCGDEQIGAFVQKLGFSKRDIHYRSVGGKSFCDKWLKLGLEVGQYAHEKTVPQVIMQSSKETVANYLSGLFDGDGTAKITNGAVSLATSSLALAKQVQMLLLNFGIVAGINCKNVSGKIVTFYNGFTSTMKEQYVISLAGYSDIFYNQIGFRLARKQERATLLAKKRLGSDMPNQKKKMQSLYRTLPCGQRGHKDGVYALVSDSAQNNASEFSIQALLSSREPVTQAYADVERILDLNYFWARVRSVVDAGRQETFDLHVPTTNAYVANGLIAHNTFEDLDLCFTVRATGKKVIFLPEARGYHYVGMSALGSNTPFPTQRNEMIFRARWGANVFWDEWQIV